MKWYVLTGIIVGGGAAVAGLGWYFLGKKKNSSTDAGSGNDAGGAFDQAENKISTNSTSTYTPPKTTTSSGFPLKKGSKGEFVKNLQNALIQKFGAKVLPKYGAD